MTIQKLQKFSIGDILTTPAGHKFKVVHNEAKTIEAYDDNDRLQNVAVHVSTTETFNSTDGRILAIRILRADNDADASFINAADIEAFLDEDANDFAEQVFVNDSEDDIAAIFKKADELYADKPEPINIYGLYRNIVPRVRIPSIRSNKSLDDQTNGWWLVYLDADQQPYLVDTYHIQQCSTRSTDEFLQKRIKALDEKTDESEIIWKSNFEFCYGGSIKLTDENRKYFELVEDIRNLKLTNVPEHYVKKDVIPHVKLWFEHAWRYNGVSLVRADAKPDSDRIVLDEIRDIIGDARTPYAPSDYRFQNMKKPESDDARKLVELAQQYISKLQELSDEFNEFYDGWAEEYREVSDRIDAE